MSSLLYKTQYKIYQNLKKRAYSYEGDPSPLLESYRDNYEAYASRGFDFTDLETMLQKVSLSQVTYLADFHTHDQNSRNLIRIIKSLVEKNKKFIVGLEMVNADDTHMIQAFLDRHITELEFLECINYHDSWRFPWNHYKALFEEAKKYKFEVIGLNSVGQLDTRDKVAAQIISETVKDHPDVALLVLFGELHITPNKLPQKVMMRSDDASLKQVIIHQNIDKVFWKAYKGEEKNSEYVVQFNDDEYCLISSPPWLKYESMCYWYEGLIDDPEYDIHNYIIEKGLKTFNYSTQENFLTILDEAIKLLFSSDSKVYDPLCEDDYDLNLYDHRKVDYILERIEGYQSQTIQQYLKYLLQHNKSFILPETNILYCGNYSSNKLAKLSGKFFYQSQLIKEKDVSIAKLLSGRDFQAKVIYLISNHFISYVFAKIMNPHLKCDLYLDLIHKNSWPIDDEKNAAPLAAKILETQTLECINGKKLGHLHHVCKFIGEILGENTFHHHLSDFPQIFYYCLNISHADLAGLLQLTIKDIPLTNQRKRIF